MLESSVRRYNVFLICSREIGLMCRLTTICIYANVSGKCSTNMEVTPVIFYFQPHVKDSGNV